MFPSQQQQHTSINPVSLKTQLAYRFHLALKNLTHTKRSDFEHTQIHRRSRRVKIAAYASMASVTGSRRAWSRAILWKIRNKKMKMVVRKTTRVGSKRRRRNTNPKRENNVDPFGNSGLEVKLRKLVPGAETMDACGLLEETADYIKCLATQVEVMRSLVDLYSTI